MNADGRRDRKSGDARVAGISRSPLLGLPIQSEFFGPRKNQELLLPSASDCAVSAIAKDQRRRLDEEHLAQVQSISRSFHLSKKEFCPNYPGHCFFRTAVNPLRCAVLSYARALVTMDGHPCDSCVAPMEAARKNCNAMQSRSAASRGFAVPADPARRMRRAPVFHAPENGCPIRLPVGEVLIVREWLGAKDIAAISTLGDG